MDNPETLAKLGTPNTDRRPIKHTSTTQHRKLKDEQHDPYQYPGVTSGAREG